MTASSHPRRSPHRARRETERTRPTGHHRASQRQIGACRLDGGDARRVEPAHLARAHSHACMPAATEHDGVGFHVLADPPGEQQIRPSAAGVGATFVTTRSSASGEIACSSGDCTSRPPPTRFSRRHHHLDELLAEDAPRVATSSGRLKAMMPPKAEVGVGAIGLHRPADIRRHGHAAGVGVLDDDAGRRSNWRTHSQAASASAMLLYDSSLPCSCAVKVASVPGPATGRGRTPPAGAGSRRSAGPCTLTKLPLSVPGTSGCACLPSGMPARER
jgi:hypothetical protein